MTHSTRSVWLALVVVLAAVAAGLRGDKSADRLSDEEVARLRKKFQLQAHPFRAMPPEKIAALAKDPEFQRLVEELRLRTPYVSIADRLAFENGKSVKAPKLPARTLERLEAFEKSVEWRQNWDGRVAALERLHSKEVASFVSRPGFGMERRPRAPATPLDDFSPRPRDLPLITLAPLSPDAVGASVSLPEKASAAGGQVMPALDRLANLHEFGRGDFVNPSGFGHVKERRVTAGFEPHHFRHAPDLALGVVQPKDRPKEHWLLRRLELVSLLKHDKPVAYESDQLPRMDRLAKAKTRPLGDFEARALASLQKGEDLVAEATTNTIRMVGSIRATKQCLSCHNGERGALLGAFTYQLQRDPPLVAK